jgi:hypothetical protein
MIKEMSTKFPFSNVAHRAETEEYNMQTSISYRVLEGLVPSKNNKSKALSKEQERLYTQILQSENKDFHILLQM